MASRRTNRAGKRKLADPIAAAALDALSSSSSSSSSDDDDDDYDDAAPARPPAAKRTKRAVVGGGVRGDDARFPASSSSSDDGALEPKPGLRESLSWSDDDEDDDNDAATTRTTTKRTKPSASDASDEPSEGGSAPSKRGPRKPLFEVGSRVCAAWWPDRASRRGNRNASWHRGTVRAYREEEASFGYGPQRFYHVAYDDGDELEGVEDHFVFSALDYDLMERNDFKSEWIGLRNVCDEEEGGDKWARTTGWYVVTIGGEERTYTYLSEAMDAYDKSVVEGAKRKGRKVKRSELNRPDQYPPDRYPDLFEDFDPDGDGEEGGAEGASERNAAGEHRREETNIHRAERNGPGRDEPSSPRHRFASAYDGVSYSKQDRKYVAQVEAEGRIHCLGYYKFEADAALAADKGSVLGSCGRGNFSTREEYQTAIRRETEAAGHRVDVAGSYDGVAGKVGVYLTKIYEAEQKAIDAELGDDGSDEDSDGDGGTSVASDRKKDAKGSQNDNSNNHGPGSQSKKGKSHEGRENVNGNKGPGSNRKRGKFHGVGYTNASRRFRASIRYALESKQKFLWLGSYKLEADAALAHDEAVRLLQPGENAQANFATILDYANAKDQELVRTGYRADDAMGSAAIASKVAEIISKAHPNLANLRTQGHSDHDPERKSPESKRQSKITDDDMAPEKETDDASDSLTGDNNKTPSPTMKSMATSTSNLSNKIVGKVSKIPSPQTTKRKSSDYVGVSYHKGSKSWRSNLTYDGKRPSLGGYKLEVDAARAYDEAVTLLGMPEKSNFATLQGYEEAKLRELERTGLAAAAAMSPSAIAAKVAKIISKAHFKILSPQTTKRKSSDYVGVSYAKGSTSWVSNLQHDGKRPSLGAYKLEVDAARAYDEAVTLLGMPEKSNFATLQGYEEAKLRELERTGLAAVAAMSPSAIAAKVAKIISKAYPNLENRKRQKPNGDGAESGATSDATGEPNANVGPERALVVESKVQHKQHSKFIGVRYIKRSRTYVSNIMHGRKSHYLGSYKLEADAAIAYDEASKLLRGADSKVNFASSPRDYTDARRNELVREYSFNRERSRIETLVQIAAKIQKYLSKIPCPAITALHDEMANKWRGHLPRETGNEYLESYKKHISDVLGPAKIQKSKLDTAAPSIHRNNQDDISASAMEIESVQGKRPDAFFKPIAEGNTDDSSSKSRDVNATNDGLPQEDVHSEPGSDSDDDMSLVSDAEENAAEESNILETNASTGNNSTSILPDSRGDTNEIIAEMPDPINEFPIGCPVLWNLDCPSFLVGKVTSAPIDGNDKDTAYEVMPTKSKCSTVIAAKSLAYGINCPVYVSHGSASRPLKGKILFCKLGQSESFSYAVLIDKEGNQFQVMKDVPSARVKYRGDTEAEASPSPANKNVSSANRGSAARHAEVPSPAKKTSIAKPAPAAEENGTQASSRKFFSSNSTITSVDSPPSSSRRAVVQGRSNGHDGGSNVNCCVFIPHWLIHDTTSKKRLISHLLFVDTRVNNQTSLERIGRSTNCHLRMIEREGIHVLIQTKQGRYATEDIRKAGEKLEHVLLEHIRHDGSRGRLFYDLARSCEFLHPKGSSESTSVMQRNPFTANNEMGWMNILELPYVREAGGRKHHHGHYLLTKEVLGHVKHETRCVVKLCGDEFKVPTKFCPPYVWIIGDNPGRVDRAKEILMGAIRRHMSNCTCVQ